MSTEVAERHESEGRIVTIRARLTEVGNEFAVIEPINAELGQSMAVALADIVDLGEFRTRSAT